MPALSAESAPTKDTPYADNTQMPYFKRAGSPPGRTFPFILIVSSLGPDVKLKLVKWANLSVSVCRSRDRKGLNYKGL